MGFLFLVEHPISKSRAYVFCDRMDEAVTIFRMAAEAGQILEGDKVKVHMVGGGRDQPPVLVSLEAVKTGIRIDHDETGKPETTPS